MDIFIDESGQFIPLGGRTSRAAAVIALVVPSASRTQLFRAFRRLRREMRPGVTEVKGSSLSEDEAAAVFALLGSYDLIAEAVVIDIGNHSADEVSRFKAQQAHRLLSGVTREHQPGLIQDLLRLREAIRQLPDQLFVQAFCIWELLPRLLETATMYYSQRTPAELASFAWRVDAKDKARTPLEVIWSSLIRPLIHTRTSESPIGMIPGGDYRFYERFDTNPEPPEARQEGKHYTNLRMVFGEDFQFMSSRRSLGLQLADIVSATLTRALNGKLQQRGWQRLGTLFVRRTEQTIRLIALSSEQQPPPRRTLANERWASVIMALEEQSKPMITARVARAMPRADE